MQSKVKTIYGLYKLLGRDAFLAAAKNYSEHVQPTVEATLSEMESRWYDRNETVTEAEQMLNDYRNGYLTKEFAERLAKQEQIQDKFYDNITGVLKKVHPTKLAVSYESPNHSYAGELLRDLHNAFVDAYGTDYLDRTEFMFVNIPAVLRSRDTGKMCLGIVLLDLQSSGEHWGTDFITPYGMVSQGDENATEAQKEFVKEFIPYDYWYTATLENDIHVSYDDVPEDVDKLLSVALGEIAPDEFEFIM